MLDRTVSLSSTAAAVSSQDVSIPRVSMELWEGDRGQGSGVRYKAGDSAFRFSCPLTPVPGTLSVHQSRHRHDLDALPVGVREPFPDFDDGRRVRVSDADCLSGLPGDIDQFVELLPDGGGIIAVIVQEHVAPG